MKLKRPSKQRSYVKRDRSMKSTACACSARSSTQIINKEQSAQSYLLGDDKPPQSGGAYRHAMETPSAGRTKSQGL